MFRTFSSHTESDERYLKNRNALNLLYRGLQLNLYDNNFIESVSNDLTEAPLPAVSKNAVKSKRHDITPAHTYLNQSIIRPDIQIYTYYADYPEPNDMTDSILTVDLAKHVQATENTSSDNYTNDSTTVSNDPTKYALPNDLATLARANEPIFSNDNSSGNENVENIFGDIDKMIFDSGFLRIKEQSNDNAQFNAPIDDFTPLPIPNDSENEHRNVKRHKNGIFTDKSRAPITHSDFYTNGISVDLQKDEGNKGQLGVRFNSDNERVTQSPLQKFSQQIGTSSNGAQAYFFTSIENNRPSTNYAIQHPPLQSYYPASIQNNYASRSVRPLEYRPTPIPSSLPSIVYSPNAVMPLPSYVQQSVRIPPSLTASTQAASNAQYYSTPAIGTPYAIRPCDVPVNRPNEKIVVKIVPASGWYLNDEKERKSYFDAVARGLLNENGFVYVNDVQSYSSQPSQNVPTVWYSSSVPLQSPPSPTNYNNNQRWQFPPYGSPVPALQQQRQPEPSHLNTENNVFRGATSYSVPLQSVGILAGDKLNEPFNLASLRSSGVGGSSTSTDRIYNSQNAR